MGALANDYLLSAFVFIESDISIRPIGSMQLQFGFTFFDYRCRGVVIEDRLPTCSRVSFHLPIDRMQFDLPVALVNRVAQFHF